MIAAERSSDTTAYTHLTSNPSSAEITPVDADGITAAA